MQGIISAGIGYRFLAVVLLVLPVIAGSATPLRQFDTTDILDPEHYTSTPRGF